jgi:hypothetical protein
MIKGNDLSIIPFRMQNGGPCWNRTNNLLIKSQVLCLVELTAPEQKRKMSAISFIFSCQMVFQACHICEQFLLNRMGIESHKGLDGNALFKV